MLLCELIHGVPTNFFFSWLSTSLDHDNYPYMTAARYETFRIKYTKKSFGMRQRLTLLKLSYKSNSNIEY